MTYSVLRYSMLLICYLIGTSMLEHATQSALFNQFINSLLSLSTLSLSLLPTPYSYSPLSLLCTHSFLTLLPTPSFLYQWMLVAKSLWQKDYIYITTTMINCPFWYWITFSTILPLPPHLSALPISLSLSLPLCLKICTLIDCQ